MTVVRRLRPDAWPAVRRIRLASEAADPGHSIRPPDDERGRPEEHWRAMLDGDTGAVFGVVDGDAMVGVTAVIIDRAVLALGTAGMGMTWLRPSYRGRGLSRPIYGSRIAWARDMRPARMIVSHRAGNEPSRRAIPAHGVYPLGATPTRWPDGVLADHLVYEFSRQGTGA